MVSKSVAPARRCMCVHSYVQGGTCSEI